ncbi:MAG: pyridoxamine 5'-phosphate oxidase family protein [Defluviitaleaceae bacterium]|nr:pyridoxamine 5'-phosphate oxidase family protein [Defluviitaleaceae bacterium]
MDLNEKLKKASEIIQSRTASGEYKNQHCVLAQEDLDGRVTAAVITPSRANGIGQLTFCSGVESNWAKRARRDSRAAVCFSSEEYSITLRGKLEVLTDTASKRENWYTGMENHFPNADDPNYCVLRFTTEKYKLFVDWQEVEGSFGNL